MKRLDNRVLWGTLLITAGILFLMQEINIVSSALGILWGILIGLAGMVFIYAFITDRSQWWTLIPGLSLLGISAIILISELFPWIDTSWSGTLILGAIGLSFWLVYLFYRDAWWAIIPGGVMVTLAVVSGLEPVVEDTGWIFFLGLGLTFALVGILPTSRGKMTWAFIPAAILMVMGIIIATPYINALNYFWPVVLILGGGYIILRNLRS